MRKPADCTTMAEIRAEIDRLDEDLVRLFAERAGYIDRAAEIKAEVDLPARIDARVEQVVGNVRRHAETYGLPPDLVEKLWRRLIDWSIAREENGSGRTACGRDEDMAATIIDGKALAADVRARVALEVARLKAAGAGVPGLAVVLVGEDPASQVYVRSKGRQTVEAGMASFEHRLDEGVSEADLLAVVARLNADPAVHGILVQLPLPGHMNADAVIAAIDPAKDVDGFHISNVGLLATGQRAMVPCTPLGCLMLLRAQHGSLSGMEAVVIGRSNIVGKPMAQLLLGDSCTVTVAHSRTRDLPGVVRRADIVVAAVGRPGMVTADWVKPGATVIDVGINRVGERLVGDVDFAGVSAVAGAITPVPGGVGPMTIACLLANTLTAFCRSKGLPEPEGLTV